MFAVRRAPCLHFIAARIAILLPPALPEAVRFPPTTSVILPRPFLWDQDLHALAGGRLIISRTPVS